MSSPDARRLTKVLIRLLGPALLVLLILKMPHRAAIWSVLASARAAPVAVALILNAAACELKVVRWRVLLRTRNIFYPLGRTRAVFYASLYVAMLTPGRVGDVLRIQYLRHDLDVPYAEGLASIVMDRLCDIYVLLAFVLFAIIRYSSVLVGSTLHLTWAVLTLTAILPLLLFVPGAAEGIARVLYRRLAKEQGGGGFPRFLEAVRANVGPALLITLPLTAAAFLVNYVQGYLLAHAIGLDISFLDATCLLAIASLLGLIPISVSGVGVRELLFALILPALGYAPEAGVSFGLLVFVVIYLVLVGVGFIAWQVAPPPSGARPLDKRGIVK